MGETVRNVMAWILPALALPALALMVVGGTAVPAFATPVPPAAEATVDTGAQGVTIAPMPDAALPDAALPGAYCLAGAAAAMTAVFAAGPTESLMILSGAMHLPTSTAVLVIPLLSILGGGACAIGAAAQPAVSWAIEQSDNIAANIAAAGPTLFAASSDDSPGAARKEDPVPPVRPLTEGETQSVGCVAGALAGFGAAMATSPMEVAMLSSGANTVVSSTPVLALGLLGTIVASGCAIGTYGILPIQAFFSNFTAIGDSLVSGLSGIGTMVSDGAARTLALLNGRSPAVEIADGAASR